ncbi:MAG: AsmA family protein [Planctomycetes bacterium]|nr:AsmA family protein [Planctomycetota bacterium]
MRRLLRAIVFLITLVVVLAVAGGVVAILFTDKAVKTVVERAGTKTLNVPVQVGKANASLLSGDVRLQDITIANPPGYQGAALVRLQRVDLQADVGSVLGKQVLIKDMKLQNMEVFIEQKGLQNNLYQVIKPLREPHEPTGKGLVIDNLEITDVTVHAGLTALPGQTPSVDLKLASIRMVDVGRNEKVDTAVLISKILLAVAAGIAEQGGGILPKETLGDLGSILDKTLDLGKIIFGPGQTSDGRQKDSLGKDAMDGIKDLFGGKKKQ